MSDTLRPDLALIAKLIPQNSRVLDLGCGDGELLQMLIHKGCTGTGVEIEPAELVAALRAGVAGLPRLDPGCALPQCVRTVHRGRTIFRR